MTLMLGVMEEPNVVRDDVFFERSMQYLSCLADVEKVETQAEKSDLGTAEAHFKVSACRKIVAAGSTNLVVCSLVIVLKEILKILRMERSRNESDILRACELVMLR